MADDRGPGVLGNQLSRFPTVSNVHLQCHKEQIPVTKLAQNFVTKQNFQFYKYFFIFIKIILIGARELFLKFFFWNHPQVTPGPSRSLMILIMQFLN